MSSRDRLPSGRSNIQNFNKISSQDAVLLTSGRVQKKATQVNFHQNVSLFSGELYVVYLYEYYIVIIGYRSSRYGQSFSIQLSITSRKVELAQNFADE